MRTPLGAMSAIMSQQDAPLPPAPEEPVTGGARRFLGGLAMLAAFGGLWFWLAGRITWWQGWALLLGFTLTTIALVLRLLRIDPQLLQERSRQAPNVEGWDKVVMSLYTISLLALLAVAALDSGRMRWSIVPAWAQALGWVMLLSAGALVWHVMGINTYLSSWARIQDDRGQQVITTGAYGRVRHPMYLGIIVLFLGLPLALASWWAFGPAALVAGLMVYRTKREDAMLMQGLDRYQDYAREVRFRLLPGLW